ncbi:MAG: hypothetical protein RMX96_26585 [Nostoc sp. ChiSLP02]|nr:hypothetical protein [Nostoc sp. DedSLP05]MDZ8188412.1 hypothetical protein [Nostoc sp. ChiSLP02]
MYGHYPERMLKAYLFALFWWSDRIYPTNTTTNRYAFPVSVVVLFEPSEEFLKASSRTP